VKRRFALALETAARGRRCQRVGKEFDCDGAIQIGIKTSIHRPHATRPERCDEFILAEPGATL
jgi:hypothetical protein